MEFLETIYELEEVTKRIDVLAIGCISNGKPDIGIRARTIFDDAIEDPIVDGIAFMICGDIYDDENDRISDINELLWRPLETLEVRIRAIPGFAPNARIDLGQYRISNCVKLETGEYESTVYRLSLIGR